MTKRNGKRNGDNPASMTLREAFERHYDKSELSHCSVEKAHNDLLRWERLTSNPPVDRIDEVVLEEFRKAMVVKHSPGSANGTRGYIRAILRRIGPPVTGNPCGLGLIPRIPYMKPSKVIRRIPRRVSQEDLSLWYIATQWMRSPRWGGPAPYWWQGFLVVCYFTGMRRMDVFRIRVSDVDFDAGTLLFTARKTMKPMRMPLHPVVVEHLQRLLRPGVDEIFGASLSASAEFHRRWNRICRKGGVSEPFTPHDVRRTATSEIERVKGGLGSVLLQHAVNDVTHVSYLNQTEELAEAIGQMRVPIAFKHGPKQAEKQIAKQREQNAAMMKAAQFAPPSFPAVEEWQFHNVGFVFRGHHVRMEGHALKILKALAFSPVHSCTFKELATVVWPDGHRPVFRSAQGNLCDKISTIRERLRHALLLPESFNPVPCVERGNGGRWTLYIPGNAGNGGAS